MAELRGVTKKLRDKEVIRDLCLKIPAGQTTGLFGANGSGKSTLARLISGLIAPDSGRIDLAEFGPAILVQQDFVVWPHLSTRQNLALVNDRCPGQKLDDLLARFGLTAAAEIKAAQLSFGQQQRLCVARAFVPESRFFIFDECLSGADAGSRPELAATITNLLREREATAIWISHDWPEVSSVCTHAAILDNGTIAQEGTPEHIYWHPATEHIAMLTGHVTLVDEADHPKLREILADSASPLQGSLRIRPELVQLLVEPKRTTFTLQRQWTLAPGYLQEFRCSNGIQIRRFATSACEFPSEGSLRITPPPCVSA